MDKDKMQAIGQEQIFTSTHIIVAKISYGELYFAVDDMPWWSADEVLPALRQLVGAVLERAIQEAINSARAAYEVSKAREEDAQFVSWYYNVPISP